MNATLAALLLLAAVPARADAPTATPFETSAPVASMPLVLESPVRRFETVFFISLPFTAIYSSLLIGAVGLAIEGRQFRLHGPYIAAGISLPILGAGWIAWRDRARPRDAAALQSNLSPR